jgi:hypothetical protein
MNGKPCVRDYNFTVSHPKGRGYPSAAAMEQFRTFASSLSPEIKDEITRGDRSRDRLRASAPLARYLIITAASEGYGPSLLALLGSLHLNWPHHPPVLVYDIGLDPGTLKWLEGNRIPVRKVPPFCEHWRKHYTWKLWCLNDAPAHDIIWMDAGLVVLQPLNEILDALNTLGYFLTTNYESLDWEASDEACNGCGVPTGFRNNKLTLPATVMGFRKSGEILQILKEALAVGLVEKNIAATNVSHRFEQAIISLLVYKHLGRVLVADGAVYVGALSPLQVPGQKIWVHRRQMLRKDIEHFATHIRGPAEPYMPSAPYPLNRAKSLANLYRVYWHFGQGELIKARENLDMAFRIDPTLKNEIQLLASRLNQYDQRLSAFFGEGAGKQQFIDWVLKQLKVINGETFVSKLTLYMQGMGSVALSHKDGVRL